jgi:hypothetical protein
MIRNAYSTGLHVKFPLFLSDFNGTSICCGVFEKKNSKFMKIRPVGAELLHADRRTGRHDEANTRISKFCERS